MASLPAESSSSSSSSAATTLQAHRKQANLKLLQRTCRPTITDIYVSATHVVLYEYRSSWHKTTQEGTLFVVQEQQSPQQSTCASLILLNRHSTDNFEVNQLTKDFQVQQQDPFLMFKHDDRVWGIWFHSAEERQAVFDGLQHIPQQLSAVASTSTTASTTITSTTTTTVKAPLPVSSPTAATTTAASPAVALDKKALQLALLSLMQDDRFLTLLHQQYLKVIRSSSSLREKQEE